VANVLHEAWHHLERKKLPERNIIGKMRALAAAAALCAS